MKKSLIIVLIFFIGKNLTEAQITLKSEVKINKVCTGNGCLYSGPKILINEVMLSPSNNDGSIYGSGSSVAPETQQGEWIELYNPDKCKPVDISCYFLGNNTPDPYSNYGGGLTLPEGTIVPPRGFVIIRGMYAPAVPSNLLIQNGGKTIEIVVDNAFAAKHVCLGGGTRLWFPNNGGWFAFYDANGVPQDAISWTDAGNYCATCSPCNPATQGCPYKGTIAAYNNIPAANKNFISSLNPKTYQGSSFRRMPDGGSWSSQPASATYGTCNSSCVPAPVITCDGEATVTASGGTEPYKYIWDDAQATITAKANGLCAGIYTVTVTDANNQSATLKVEIKDLEIDATVSATDVKCYGEKTGTAKAIGTKGTEPYSYTWSNGSSGESVTNLKAGNYVVTVSDKNGCSKKVNTIISEPEAIVVVSIVDSVLCKGQDNGSITIETKGGTQPYSYLWSTNPAQTTEDAVKLKAGKYTVTITDKNGCIKTHSAIVYEPKDSIRAEFTAEPLEGKAPLTVKFSFTGDGANKYHWEFGDNASSEDENPEHIFTKGGIYNVILVVSNYPSNKCEDTFALKIIVKEKPSFLKEPSNIMTDNSDGNNDKFKLEYENIISFNCIIFNRWGNKIYEWNDVSLSWDGKTSGGSKAAAGVYFYIIKAKGGDDVEYNFNGNFTLMR